MTVKVPIAPPAVQVTQPQTSGGVMNFAVGAMILAFIIYITAKGELGSYMQLLFYAAPIAPTAGATSATAGTNCAALAPVPITATRWPANDTESSHSAE